MKNIIYIIKQGGLYQNKVNSSLVFTCNCKMSYVTGHHLITDAHFLLW